MSSTSLFPVPPQVAENAWVDAAKYQRMYDDSLRDPDRFWGEHGKRLTWIKPYTRVKNTSYSGDGPGPIK